ncbi:5-formyltetrahydrofolate cyclo-ligase, mitochondrial isoform X2 [Herrania umbratica]|uniref:5-formyltetrahydrofolate cyclo-ligase n=1 Tax=Herrania umbratica TaxID=108875 RepID=A0A6J1AYY4_9ROSI|nr:5-formyltetrahydrofolate cyclo-ligase, mitochondrial isoform X2 [Herrania umbratica]
MSCTTAHFKAPFYRQPSSDPVASQRTSIVAMSNSNQEQDHLESIFKQKRILRSKIRQALKSMDPSLRSQEDNVIQTLVLEAPWFKSSKRLCAYISCSALREVDTLKLLSQVLQNPSADGSMLQTATKVYVPRVEDKNCNMRMFYISRIDDLVANSMSILEPAPVDADGNEREDVMHANDAVDLVIMPGLAFDRSGRRLGRGGGYYDAFVKNYKELAKERNWKQPLFVALSYSVQIIDEVIPVTSNDALVDALVSPCGVVPISPSALESLDSLQILRGLSFPQYMNGIRLVLSKQWDTIVVCHFSEATGACPLVNSHDLCLQEVEL